MSGCRRMIAFLLAISFPVYGAVVRFNCARLLEGDVGPLAPPATVLSEAETRYGAQPISLENALTVTADLLGDERGAFVQELVSLDDVPVYPTPQSGVSRMFYARSGVVFEKSIFPSHLQGQMNLLFAAIRCGFSNHAVDRYRWQHATPQERLRLILHFKARAVRVLYYQHKIFTVLAALPGGADLTLPSEADILQSSQWFFRVFSPKDGGRLFQEVRLTRELEERIQQLLPGDLVLTTYLAEYIDQTFIDNMNSVFNVGHGIVRLETLSIAALIAAGGLSAYFGGPWIPPGSSNFSDSTAPPITVFRSPSAAPEGPSNNAMELEQKALAHLREVEKSRPLTQEEKLIRAELQKAVDSAQAE